MAILDYLKHRNYDEEVMEHPDLPRADLDDALRELRVMNRIFGGVRMSVEAVAEVVRPLPAFTLLDVGCGDGEIPRSIYEWATNVGKDFEGHGIDLTQASVELAEELTPTTTPIKYSQTDLFDLDEAKPYDVVHASLILHHLNDEDALLALQKMVRLARWGVVINDLDRSYLSLAGAWLGARLTTRSYVVHADAPHSVRRSYTRSELERLAHASGAADFTLQWRFPHRWILTLRT